MIKMIRLRIKSITSKEYKKGRVDVFTIEITEEMHKNIISLLLKLGFKSDEIGEFDTPYGNVDFFSFAHKKNMRIYFINGPTKNECSLIIDSTIKKDDLMSIIEEYFQIF